jgi:hypothetical protein
MSLQNIVSLDEVQFNNLIFHSSGIDRLDRSGAAMADVG